jgi:hypothetical protein
MRFKIGDRVRFIANSSVIDKGSEGIVIDINNKKELQYTLIIHDQVWTAAVNELELIKSALETYTIQEISAELLRRYGDVKC